MVIESFLIFISTLISLNTPTKGQDQSEKAPTAIHKRDIRQPAANIECRRGGWDGN